MGKTVKWNSFLDSELRRLMLGKQIGRGVYRKVYECLLDPTLVVKVEDRVTGQFCNAAEWQAWQWNKDYKKVADWLAPCVSISANGAILLMKKVEPLVGEFPKTLPKFLKLDLKRENFGMFEGRVVKCDYPTLDHDLPLRHVKTELYE